MDRFIVAAFVATFIAAIAAVVGVPVLAQEAPPPPAAAPGGGPDGAPHMTPRARFAAMDTDHDGRISHAEWLAAGRHERGFAMMDTDHDGYLTVDEMKAGMAKMKAMREARPAQ